MMERVVVGTVVFDAVLSALRRLAQEHRSAVRLAGPVENREARPSRKCATRRKEAGHRLLRRL